MKKVKIGVWGASTTYGSGDKEMGGWVNRLRLYFDNLDGYYGSVNVYNCGVGGGTYEHLIDRFPMEAKHRRPDIIIFGGGGNDYCAEEKYGKPLVSVEEFGENLGELLKLAFVYGKKIIFCGQAHMDESKSTPVPWRESYYYNKYVDLYNSVIEKFCKEKGLVFVSMDGVLDIVEDFEDGVHANARGHEKMFRRILPFVEDLILKK